jgi:hypothetical protein
MIFGGDPKRVNVSTDMIRVRPLEPDEIRSLGTDQLIYVDDRHFADPPVLVPAYLRAGGDYYLNNPSPSAPVRTIYGDEFFASFDGVFEADDIGEEMQVVRTVGSRLSGTFFFLGTDPEEVSERVRKALRAEFGPGVVEVWNERSGPVRDIRYDVYETRTAWVPKEGSRKSKKQEGSYEIVEKRLIARGVRDGHQQHLMNRVSKGWSPLVEIHQPEATETEVL